MRNKRDFLYLCLSYGVYSWLCLAEEKKSFVSSFELRYRISFLSFSPITPESLLLSRHTKTSLFGFMFYGFSNHFSFKCAVLMKIKYPMLSFPPLALKCTANSITSQTLSYLLNDKITRCFCKICGVSTTC